jgi:hypothetical protein
VFDFLWKYSWRIYLSEVSSSIKYASLSKAIIISYYEHTTNDWSHNINTYYFQLLLLLLLLLLFIIIIMKSSFNRDNNYCHYVIQRIAGFAITLYYYPAGIISLHLIHLVNY